MRPKYLHKKIKKKLWNSTSNKSNVKGWNQEKKINETENS
jgi:hypothetical protein